MMLLLTQRGQKSGSTSPKAFQQMKERKEKRLKERERKRFLQDLNSDHWHEDANHYTTELPDEQGI